MFSLCSLTHMPRHCHTQALQQYGTAVSYIPLEPRYMPELAAMRVGWVGGWWSCVWWGECGAGVGGGVQGCVVQDALKTADEVVW